MIFHLAAVVGSYFIVKVLDTMQIKHFFHQLISVHFEPFFPPGCNGGKLIYFIARYFRVGKQND